jgi:transposase
VRLEELKEVLERVRAAGASEADVVQLGAAVDTLAVLTAELAARGATVQRLRNMLFGSKSEKTDRVLAKLIGDKPAVPAAPAAPAAGSDGTLGTAEQADSSDATGTASTAPPGAGPAAPEPRPKPKGHGRNGAEAYRGAENVKVHHDSLVHGGHCPCCSKGKVYLQFDPAVLVRVTGMAPLSATVYQKDRLRCSLCGEVFVADTPEGVGEEKYDESAASMIANLKYGTGLPFTRLEKLQGNLGIPLPAATQWAVVERAADQIEPIYEELVRQAAQGEVLHNDDTKMKVLELTALHKDELVGENGGKDSGRKQEQAAKGKSKKPGRGKPAEERIGVYTTGIVATTDGHQCALFFTGHKHAGENMEHVLAMRAADLPCPIQMCDGLSHNTAGDFESLVANCLGHGRRNFVEVADSFPEEVRYVLETLRDVFHNEALAKKQKLAPEPRLAFHQAESGPKMAGLEEWMKEQFDQRKVEPNSGLGEAIKYMQNHWQKLTLFLRVPGAPLENNICERALKMAIRHRRNSLFYKTANGARVGDIFMSFIHTAELNRADPFDYLLQLQRHAEEAERKPADWMPWNYSKTLRGSDAPATPTPSR